jgi:hypothetical protein
LSAYAEILETYYDIGLNAQTNEPSPLGGEHILIILGADPVGSAIRNVTTIPAFKAAIDVISDANIS